MAKHPLVSGVRAQRLDEEIRRAEKANPYETKTRIRKMAEEEAEKIPFDLSPLAVGKKAADEAKRRSES